MKTIILNEEKFNIVKNTVRIFPKQKEFLEENKEILKEYIQVSNPKKDTNILGDYQIWIYGNDRIGYTPHCHMFNKDKSIELEISLIDFSILNVKSPSNANNDWSQFKDFEKKFFNWLTSTESRGKTCTNQKMLFIIWDGNNSENTLYDFVFNHKNIEISDELADYIMLEEKI